MARVIRRLLAVGLSVLMLLLASCSRPMARSELIGTWVATPQSMKWIPEGGKCVISLNADGTFVASVPDRFILSPDLAKWRIIRGKGRWTYPSPDYPNCVLLDFREIDGTTQRHFADGTLLTEGSGTGATLFVWVREEGGDRFEFTRAAVPGTGPSNPGAP